MPGWWTELYEGTPLLLVITPWIFTYVNKWIEELRSDGEEMATIWCIASQKFAVFTIASFLEAAQNAIECYKTNDPRVSVEREVSRVTLRHNQTRLRLAVDRDELVQLLNDRC